MTWRGGSYTGRATNLPCSAVVAPNAGRPGQDERALFRISARIGAAVSVFCRILERRSGRALSSASHYSQKRECTQVFPSLDLATPYFFQSVSTASCPQTWTRNCFWECQPTHCAEYCKIWTSPVSRTAIPQARRPGHLRRFWPRRGRYTCGMDKPGCM